MGIENFMEKFLIAVNGLFGIIAILAGRLYLNLTKRIEGTEKGIKEVEEAFIDIRTDMQNLKLNYIDRFDSAKDDRFKMKEDVLNSLSELHNKIDVHIAQK